MILVPIKIDKWHIFAYCRSDRSCDFLEWIAKLDTKNQKSWEKLLAILDMIAKMPQGPSRLPDAICHQIDKENQIYEFIAGRLRLLWFYSSKERKVIICTNAFMKKSRKTPKKEIKQAVAIKKRYIEEQRKQSIKIIEQLS